MSEGLGVKGYTAQLTTFVSELLAAAGRADVDTAPLVSRMLATGGAFTTLWDRDDLLRVEEVKAALAAVLPPPQAQLPGAHDWYGLKTKEAFEALSPLDRCKAVDAANYARAEAERRVEDQKADAIAAAAPTFPGAENLSPETRLQRYYAAQAAAAKAGAK